MSESVVNAYDWSPVVKGDYGLWVAKYGQNTGNPGTEPNVNHWPFYIMWQYTSRKRLPGYGGDLDHNIFEGTGDVWDAYCRPIQKQVVVEPQPPKVIDIVHPPQPEQPKPVEPQPELPSDGHTIPSDPSKPESGTPTHPEPTTPQNGSKTSNPWFDYFKPLLDIARTRKFWISLAGTIVTFLTAVYGDADWVVGLTGLLTSLGVYVVPNKK